MNFTDREKELLLSNAAVYSRITLYDSDGTVLHVFNENDYLVSWEYEDYRYVPDQGFIGQFVERLLDGVLMNIPTEISLVDKEIEMEIAVKDDELEEQVYHSFGRFIITECEEEDTSGNYRFKSSDYAKKFNATFDRDMTVYPCLAIDLLNDVCQVADVDMDSDDYCFVYAVPETGLSAGNYCFSTYVGDTLTYMNFSTDTDLNYNDSLMLVVSKHCVVQRTVDSDYKVTEKELMYETSTTQVGNLLSSEALHYLDFVNNNFVIDGNQFDEGVTCREVIRCIAKLSYTWARVGVDNRLHLDFVKKSESDVDEYDEIDTDKYYEAKVTGDVVSPINKVLIGMSQVDGENIYCSRDNDKVVFGKLKGDTNQDSYSGDNLFIPTLVNDGTNISKNQCTVTLDGDEYTITATGTDPFFGNVGNADTTYSTSRGTKYSVGNAEKVYIKFTNSLINKNYITFYNSSNVSLGYQSILSSSGSVDVPSGASYCTLRFGHGGSTSGDVFKTRVMLSLSEITDFEPYVGGEPSPNPDYPQNINTVTGRNVVTVHNKNLFNSNTFGTFTATLQQILLYLKPNTSYTMSSNYLNADNTYNTGNLFLTNSDFNPSTGSNNVYDGQARSVTTNADGVIAIYYRDYLNEYDDESTTYWYQLEEGTSETDFEPYASQECEIDLGKNLYDKSTAMPNSRLDSSGNVIGENGYTCSQPIKIKPNTEYTFSALHSDYFQYATYKGDGTFIMRGNRSSAGYTNTITTQSDAYYIRIVCKNENVDTYIFEEGPIATEYAPFFTKNLFNKNNILVGYNVYTDGSVNEQAARNSLDYTEIKPNTTYIVSGLTIRNTAFYDENKEFIDYVSNVYTFTTPENAKYLRFGYVSNVSWDSAQLEEGSVVTPYQPYGDHIELCKINTYQDYIARNTGKNLFDKDNYQYLNAGFNTGGVNTLTSNATAYSIYIPCKPNTTYTFTKSLGARFFVGYTTTTPALNVEVFERKGENDSTQWTITTGNDAKYLVALVYNSSVDTSLTLSEVLGTLQIELGSSATTYEPYGNGDWYICHNIKKINMTELTSVAHVSSWTNASAFYGKVADSHGVLQFATVADLYSNRFKSDTPANIAASSTNRIGLGFDGFNVYFSIDGITTKADYDTYFANNPTYLYYKLLYPQYEKIIYQPLIDQLNATQDMYSYDGATYVTGSGIEINPQLDIKVIDLDDNETDYSGNDIEFTGHVYQESVIKIYDNSLTHSEELRRIAINGADKLYGITYTPMTINSIGHPWLNGDSYVKLTNLESNDLYFYPFDRKITYQGYLVTDLSSTAENKVQEKYENKDTIVYRLTHTEIDVDKANQRIDLLAQKTEDNTTTISDIQIDVGDIKSTVSTIENTEIPGVVSRLSSVEQTTDTIASMFQITGGINILRNSAFLLKDDVWEFTDNGTNPYHTELGNSYDATLSGTTVSVAEIKFRATKIKSKPENITHLKTDGTKYTFNFYHKQDNNMTTTIKMYSTANPSIKAFDDIIITGQKPMTNYEIAFIPTYTDYTIEIVSDSTASVGYSYVYDMMLNSGDKQSWQPASDEIYSTTLTMSRLGLQVYSVGDGTITLLGSEGLLSYETSDGKTRGRLVSKRTVDGDITKTVTTQGVYLVSDINNQNDTSRWVETVINISGNKYKVEYMESGE